VLKTGELVMLRDQFGHQRLREGKYTPGQIDGKWDAAVEKDFSTWLEDNMDALKVPKEDIQELLKTRTW
jgi:4-hydroxy-4-methyl-2-oxoglutarate aldolase